MSGGRAPTATVNGAQGEAGDAGGAHDSALSPTYEPPRIVWREPYQPLSFGLSCAKQPGNPGCMPGPTSS